MNQLIATLPLIISAVVPVLVGLARGWIVNHVDPKYFPALLSVGGGLVGALANLAGVDAAVLSHQTTDITLWQSTITGVMSGLSAVGIHQIYKQQVQS